MDYSLIALGGNVCKSLELSRQSDFILFLLTICVASLQKGPHVAI